ncbi:DUF3810 domain-containing protein [Aggregatimonas sangjinii]|uniref:DUF3810 domain-containing protein n=1 Tax=Aggregatimonas sangjinii TaxID=2583587 RepID=A0A5B7SU03_9FLAO|nr:DUF3810 domain-containing protein [Aggregatimonas sangjinii]QCX00498.1 DUF3810 domain-containing protein [Aggregatimonas sangjinii]
MNNRLRNGIALSFIPQFFLVKWAAGNSDWVEIYYSNGIYPAVSKFFRFLFGWIPFSVGEIVYTLLVILSLYYIVTYRKWILAKPWVFLRDVVMVLSVVYFTFHMMWGLNYYREPIAQKLEIVDKAEYQEVLDLTTKLLERTNALQLELTGDRSQMVQLPYTKKEVFDKTILGYEEIKNRLPFLDYEHPSIKKSMFSILSSYMGIGGYLNPFTNEAQVNALTPIFRFPVISGHEVGHQIGYSAENETNFVGYLVTLKNPDLYFQYSASAYGLSHCMNAISDIDRVTYDNLYAQLHKGVQKNYQELRDFSAAYENPVEPIFKSVFNSFLKANNQPDGIKSYSKVVHLMVGYHEKHPL